MVSFIAVALMGVSQAQAGEVLTHYDALCADTGALGPAAGEEGHWAASRIATVDVPFTVTSIKARLHNGSAGDGMCDGSLAREIRVWKSESDTPDASPEGVVVVSFDSEEVLGEERVVEGQLPSVITLNEGEYLWASINFGGTHPNVGCVKTCRADSSPGLHFWSNGSEAPYPWVDLAGTGAGGALWLEVAGEPPEGLRAPAEPEPEPVEEVVEEEAEEEEQPRRRRRR